MADEVVGRAYVEVVPKLDKFDGIARSAVRPALGRIEGDVKRTAASVETSFARAGRTAGTALQPVSRGIKKVESDARQSSTKIGKYFGDVSREIGSSFTKIAAGAAVGSAVFSFLKSSVTAASDLNETTSKTATVFGDASGQVLKFASTAATSLGQSTQQAEEAVATFGNLLEGLKIAPKLAASMSIELDKLASDFASFHNANPADVIEALTAAFRGEFDPVQKFVPTINAATVQLEALKETGKQNAAALTLQEKGLATYNILLKGAGPALGDFARTSGGAANQGRILAAQFENLKTKVGQVLLPALTFTFKTLNSGITSLLNAGDAVQKFGAPVVTVVHAIGDAFGFLGDHKSAVIGVATAVGTLYVGLKLIAAGKFVFKSIVSGFETMYIKALYAADGVRGLNSSMTIAKATSLGLNAVLAVAAIGVGIWAQKHAEAKARLDEVKAAVEADSGAIGKNTRELVANRLETSGVLRSAQTLGISLSLVTDAALGNESAMRRVRAELLQYNTGGVQSGRVTTEQAQAASLLSQRLGDLPPDVKAATEATQRQTEAAKESTVATDANADAQKRAALAAQEQKRKEDELYESLNKLADVNLSALSAHLQFQRAILDVDGSLKGLTSTTKAQTLSLSANTEAGAAARAQLISNVQLAVSDANAQKARGVSIERVNATLNADIAALRAHYLHLGYDRDAVDSVIRSLGNLGKKHATPKVSVDATKAQQKIVQLQLLLDHLNGRKIKTYVYNFIENRTTAVGGGKLGGATGGVVGQSLGYRQAVDTELVWAQPGEGMIVPRTVKLLGGPAGVARLNRGLLPGLPVVGTGADGGGNVAVMPGAVQVYVNVGSREGAARLEDAVRRAVDDALTSLVTRLRAGARR